MDSGGTLGFSNLGWWAPAALLLAAGGALLVLGHRRAPAGSASLALRATGLLLLCLCLLEPSWTTRHAKPGANLFVVLADNSKGLVLRDRGASRTRGGPPTGPGGGTSGSPHWPERR